MVFGWNIEKRIIYAKLNKIPSCHILYFEYINDLGAEGRLNRNKRKSKYRLIIFGILGVNWIGGKISIQYKL